MPLEVSSKVKLFRYRERFNLSYADAVNEPNEEIEQAFVIWSLDAQRAKLETALHKRNTGSS